MNRSVFAVAVVGSYRKGGVVDRAVDAVLASAREHGATTKKIYLLDTRIEFCTNCRACMQIPGEGRGACAIADDMNDLLDTLEQADAFVLGSPMNVGTVTALMKRFIERLGVYAYWPWGAPAPAIRHRTGRKKAIVITSSAAPACIARLGGNTVSLLKKAARLLGGCTVGVLSVGLAAGERTPALGSKAVSRARLLGKKLATAR